MDMLLGSDVFPLISSLGIGARGLDTPAERDFLIEVMTGSRKMGIEALRAMTNFRKIRAIKMMIAYNAAVEDGSLDEYFEGSGLPKKLYDIPEMPEIVLTSVAEVRTIEEAKAEQVRVDAEAEKLRRQQGG